MLSKNHIERAILGACLYCEGYPQVAHILSPKNFISNDLVKNREVFEVIASLYPTTPIDLITVTQKMGDRYPSSEAHEIANWIFQATNDSVSASSNLISWAFILLQMDINNKFSELLHNWRVQRDFNHEHVEAAALLEIIQSAQDHYNTFEVIENAILYFEHMKMVEELEGTRDLFKSVSDKCRNIQRVDSINVAMRYLFLVTDCSNNQVKTECEVFAKAIADMISTGQSNKRYTEAVELINR